ncbi:7666_t:CDS:2 [Ambispora leptoticha]|uniref:7666_t:CDS:1 n=1 Tax=Ambispora leptoticha TaxID=144679 RepID=A0A9N9F410_9GLOM|nr:7666_t:CDS:2 [Ambispora leptoticha]
MNASFKELTIVNPPPLFVDIEITDSFRRSLYKRAVNKAPIVKRTVNKVPIDELIHFINERQKIFIKKSKGMPFPYTEDKVLSKFRFTNVFREDDKTSVIITNILSDHDPTDEFYLINLIIHRLVSRKSINERLKYITDIDEGWAILENRKNRGLPVSTNAFQSTITFEARRDQWEKVFEYGKKVWAKIIKRNPQPTLYDAYIELKEDKDIPQIGTFTAWQIACDMLMMGMVMYGDNKAFAILGPGAEEGLKYFERSYNFELLLQKVNMHLGSHFEGRTLRGLDLEHILCEFQKYYKATQGDSRGLRKYEDD